MATPTTNFGFSSLNTEILQRTSTTSIGLNDAAVRLGYGATSQVSLSDLRRAYGATITSGTYSSKFVTFNGFQPLFDTGSLDDNIINASSPLATLNSFTTVLSGTATASFTTGTPFLGSECQRVATAGVQRTITGDGANYIDCSYSFPASGNVTVGFKWTV